MREQLPGEETTKCKYRIWNIVGFNSGEAAKENAEHHHRGKRLQDCPSRSERRLFITDLDIPPCQEVKKFPVLPEFSQLEGSPGSGRADHNLWSGIDLLRHTNSPQSHRQVSYLTVTTPFRGNQSL